MLLFLFLVYFCAGFYAVGYLRLPALVGKGWTYQTNDSTLMCPFALLFGLVILSPFLPLPRVAWIPLFCWSYAIPCAGILLPFLPPPP